MKYDLVITGAHVIDPAHDVNRVTSVAISARKFVAVGDDINPLNADRIINADGRYLTPGWIDMHVHTYSRLSFSHPDTIGVLHGVPTIVDAGGGGLWTYDDCRAYWEGKCKTDILAFVYHLPGGLGNGKLTLDPKNYEQPEQTNIPPGLWKEMIDRNRDRVRALKGGIHTYLGIRPIEVMRSISEAADIPYYLHLGDIVPSAPRGPRITRQVVDSLRPGDTLTHAYTGNWGNLLDDEGVVFPEVLRAQRRGVILSVAFGGNNFSFEAFDKLFAQGIIADVISSDLQGVSITGPAHSLAHVMSLFLNNGFTLKDVVERVTINPARALRLEDKLGSLTPGLPARITVFGMEEGAYKFRDAKGKVRQGTLMIVPKFCVMDGEVIDCDFEAGLAQENWSYMQYTGEGPAPHQGELDQEQRDFLHLLASTCERVDWESGKELHMAYHRCVDKTGLDSRKAADAVYNTFLESRFVVPVGYLFNTMNRDFTLQRLQGV